MPRASVLPGFFGWVVAAACGGGHSGVAASTADPAAPPAATADVDAAATADVGPAAAADVGPATVPTRELVGGEGLRIRPDDSFARAWALVKTDPGAAISRLEAFAQKGVARAWVGIGRARRALGDEAGAVAAFDRYLELLPNANDADAVRAERGRDPSAPR